jgi:hypothetical protein
MLCTNEFRSAIFADNSAIGTAFSRKRFRVTKPAACSDGTRIDSSLVSSGEDEDRRRGPGRHMPLPQRGTDARDGGDGAHAGITGARSYPTALWGALRCHLHPSDEPL